MPKRYKGLYVAQVEIDFDIDAKLPSLLPFETMQAVISNEMTPAIKRIIEEEIVDDFGTVTVTQQYADLCEAEEDESQGFNIQNEL